MSSLEAFMLGILQGLTEFLPVSSSGHLELGHYLFGIDPENGFAFSLAVHGATVLSTIVVFRKEIAGLIAGALAFRMNNETRYLLLMALSMIPIAFSGIFLKDRIEALFSGNVVFVGSMLLITATLLFMTRFFSDKGYEINWSRALLIGVAQAFAVLPGISRSGATIATGMMLGVSRDKIAAFSFLMVLVPVIGANILKFAGGEAEFMVTEVRPLVIGFIAAFIAGYFACRGMIALVRKSKLVWFSIYCMVVGLVAILFL